MTECIYAKVQFEDGSPEFEGRITIHDSGWVELHSNGQWAAPRQIKGRIVELDPPEPTREELE